MSVHDAPFMLGLLNDPSWIRYIGDRGVRTVDDARAYILGGAMAMYARLGHGFCIVERKEDGCPIGICGLARRDYLDDVDLGYALLPEFAGQGYAQEAAAAVLAHATGTMGLQRIVATVRPDNLRSSRLLEKLGMRFERTIRHPDGTRDLHLFAIDHP
jgi:RimJ/RimL family protein N-acetyltransferase